MIFKILTTLLLSVAVFFLYRISSSLNQITPQNQMNYANEAMAEIQANMQGNDSYPQESGFKSILRLVPSR